ncbi:hypothetical protein CsatB_015769 [Cannabis sativa]
MLNMEDAYFWNDVTIFETSVAEKLSCLVHLNISCVNIKPSAIRAIGNHCKNLERLDRAFVPVTKSVGRDEEAFAIASTIMLKLKHLNISYTGATTKGVLKILNSCPQLQYLDISECCDDIKDSLHLFDSFKPCLKIVANFIDHKAFAMELELEDDDDDGEPTSIDLNYALKVLEEVTSKWN